MIYYRKLQNLCAVLVEFIQKDLCFVYVTLGIYYTGAAISSVTIDTLSTFIVVFDSAAIIFLWIPFCKVVSVFMKAF